jgi:outer membrane lipoprotein-sorting protein
MKQLTIKLIIFLAIALSLLQNSVSAETSEDKGLAIAMESDKRDTGFKDYTSDMRMILRNKHGKESLRQIRMKVFEVDGDGDKSLTVFDNPRDVKGTAFLNYTHKVGDDDQWLYLPALKRVKRISSRNKSGSFVGSEFSYEDISSQEIEKYTYKWVRDENYEGRQCFLVDHYPVDKKNSGYTRQLTWIDKKEYRPLKIEFYDKKHSHLKTLTFSGYKIYLDKYWRADTLYMINHQNGKSTRLEFSNYKLRTGLKTTDFNKNSLKRIR